MPFAATRGGRLYWRQDGASSRPALLLLHPALFDHTIWDRLAPFLADHFRVIRVDLPGHGASPERSQDGTAAALADDMLMVLDDAEIKDALVCGLSLGGLIGLEMAAAMPHRVRGVVAGLESHDVGQGLLGRRVEPGLTAGEMVDRFFNTRFTIPEQGRLATWLDPLRQAMRSISLEGYRQAAACHATTDVARLIAECKTQGNIILVGDHGNTPSWLENASLSVIRSTAKCLPPVEAPGEFAFILGRLYDRIQPDGAGMNPAVNGERVRRAVLGDSWVDRSIAARDTWINDYQQYATQVAWHTIWGRKGLDYRTRRLLVLALTSALGRWEEFRLHVRIGIEQGSLTIHDVKEVCLQTGLYAGVPVSNTAFNEARAMFSELGVAFQVD